MLAIRRELIKCLKSRKLQRYADNSLLIYTSSLRDVSYNMPYLSVAEMTFPIQVRPQIPFRRCRTPNC